MEKIRMTLRLVEPLNKHLTKLSLEKGQSKNMIITEACWKLIENLKKKGFLTNKSKQEQR